MNINSKAKPIVKKLGTVQTIDMETGEVIDEKPNAMMLLPTAPGVCSICAVDHAHDFPHNQQSLHYQYHFYAEHGRWPTWSDAMAHCTDDMKVQWRTRLVKLMREKGVIVPDDLLEQKPAGR